MEGIRFFIKFENNRNLNIQKYYETQILAKFDSEVLRLIMKHIIKSRIMKQNFCLKLVY